MGGFFIFLFFIFTFYKNIFSFSKFTRIYPVCPAAGRLAPGRPAAGRQGLICKNIHKKIVFRSLKDRSPGSEAAGPSGRPAAGRPVQASWFFNIFRWQKELVFHLPAGLIVTGSLLSLSPPSKSAPALLFPRQAQQSNQLAAAALSLLSHACMHTHALAHSTSSSQSSSLMPPVISFSPTPPPAAWAPAPHAMCLLSSRRHLCSSLSRSDQQADETRALPGRERRESVHECACMSVHE